MMDASRLSSMFFSAQSEHREIASLCLRLKDVVCCKADGWELEVKGMLCQLWSLLRRAAQDCTEVDGEDDASVARIKKSIRFMNENFKSKITLEDIAVAGNLSKSGFCRCFKRITRQTPFEYLMHLRIRKSLEILREEGSTVTEAAQASGFSDSSYYTLVFRRYMGYTPRDYVKRIKNSGGR